MDKLVEDYKAAFPGNLYVGNGSLDKIKDILNETRAARVVVLLDGVLEDLEEIQQFLGEIGPKLVGTFTNLPIEPTRDSIQEVYINVVNSECELLVAVGGGSIMDMTKVVAAAVTNKPFAESNFWDTSLLMNPALPTVMIPTTAGTGAEATPNAIFLVPEQDLKVGVISPQFVADYVILDPALTKGLPPALTASTGLDALCHAVESYLSQKANPISKIFSLNAAALIADNIEKAYLDGTNMEARENMLLSSFLAGLCLSSSTTVAVHALSYPLGGKYHIPHGISNAILLPKVLQANLPSCREAYGKLADAMLPENDWKEEEKPEGFVEYITGLCKRMGIPTSLKAYGVKKEDVDYLTDNVMQVKRLLGQNPHELTKKEIADIYLSLLQ